MKVYSAFGVSIPERDWVPTPRYLLRRNRVLKHFAAFPLGEVLEIGSGSGALLYDLSGRGFTCCALEQSLLAIELIKYVNRNKNVEVFSDPQKDWRGKFDYLLAFEVLEHIQDDLGALTRWVQWLKPGGILLASVPAHPQKWNATDVWAGHVRRYTRSSFVGLVDRAGMSEITIESYGFPLANFFEPFRIRYHADLLKKQDQEGSVHRSQTARTAQSGTHRDLETRIFPLLSSWFGMIMMKVFFRVQDCFLDTELGNGYLIKARKTGSHS